MHKKIRAAPADNWHKSEKHGPRFVILFANLWKSKILFGEGKLCEEAYFCLPLLRLILDLWNVLATVKFSHQKCFIFLLLLPARTELGSAGALSQSAIFVSLKAAPNLAQIHRKLVLLKIAENKKALCNSQTLMCIWSQNAPQSSSVFWWGVMEGRERSKVTAQPRCNLCYLPFTFTVNNGKYSHENARICTLATVKNAHYKEWRTRLVKLYFPSYGSDRTESFCDLLFHLG